MKLIEKKVLTGTITLETGLHIGGAKTALDIGGLDLPVIKTPKGVPYIPGSSLKGKIRSLLAKKEGSMDVKTDSHLLRKMFGGVEDKDKKQEITRLIFRDAYLDEEKFRQDFPEKEVKLETDYTEIKTENTIDRPTGKAKHPRTIERVPAGAVFHFEIILDKYQEDTEDFIGKLKEGFDLLQNDYLGGSGTRGYGKVKIEWKS